MSEFKNVLIEQILEFLGLRSKMYSYTVDGETKSKNICKGINKYINTLYTHEPKFIYQNGIRSYEHELYSETQYKKCLSCYDDKVYICDNNINTYSFGHYKII